MTQNRRCDSCSTAVALLVSIIIASVITVLAAFGLLPQINFGVWILAAIAVLNWAIFAAVATLTADDRRTPAGACMCCTFPRLAAGVIASLIFAIITIALPFAATSVAALVFLALTIFSVVFTFITFVSYLSCIQSCRRAE